MGYGCTWRAGRLPDRGASRRLLQGYDRGLSGVAHVLRVRRRAPVRGRICMNMCMVDVTDIPGVGVEDEVVLLGARGGADPAEQLAAWCGTISYEVVSRIHPGLPGSSFKPLICLPARKILVTARPVGPAAWNCKSHDAGTDPFRPLYPAMKRKPIKIDWDELESAFDSSRKTSSTTSTW